MHFKRGLIGALTTAAVLMPAAATEARSYSNCTALHRHYAHGVGRLHAHDHVRGSTAPVTNFKRSNRLYRQNAYLDRDRDHVACEAH